MSDQKITPHQGQGAKENNFDKTNPSTLTTVRNKLPSDVRVLRLIAVLHDLVVADQGGAEPLWSYSSEEIGAAFDFLKHTDLEQLRAAIAESARRDGGHAGVRLAQVLDFPEKGKL
jgi:hypothetical protein